MRRNGRWYLTDFQRLLVVLTCAVAVFIAAMSVGLGSIVLAGVALLLLILVGLVVFLLGLRYTGGELAEGEARVLAAPPPPPGKIVSRCDLRLQVHLPGQTVTTMRHRDPSVPLTKWPRVGTVLPIDVNPRTRSLRVRWDRVAPHSLEPVSIPAQPTEPPVQAVPAPVVGPVLPLDSAPFYMDYADGALDGSLDGGATANLNSEVVFDPPADATPEPQATLVMRARQAPPPAEALPPSDAESQAREADYELPMRGSAIPAPRPAEPTRGGSLFDAGAGAMGVMLVVSDLGRSVRFYRDLVGMTVVDQAANAAVLAFGGGRVVLRQLADMSPVERRVSHLHITVSNLDTAYRDLVARGVQFVHVPRVVTRGEKQDQWAATFRDPDGHDIALTQWRDAQA